MQIEKGEETPPQSNLKNPTTMETFLETITRIKQEILNSVTCHHACGYCTWLIKGKWHDADGIEHTTTIHTHNEELATGWKVDQYDINLYNEYRDKWAQELLEHLVDNYEI